MAQSCSTISGMTLSHKIRLKTTPAQEEYFRRASGVARFAYNWALAEWKEQYRRGRAPSVYALARNLNAIKHERFPWMYEVTKTAPQQAILNLGQALTRFFNDLGKHRQGTLARRRVRIPRFKKKGYADCFRADNGTDFRRRPDAVRVEGASVALPRIGWIRMFEEVRFAGRILSVTVSRSADKWYASFCIELAYEPEVRQDESIVGVDLGIRTLATLSDFDQKISSPKPLRKYLQNLRRLSRSLSRKKRGSKNRVKARTKLARLHRRIANIRIDALHKATSRLMRYRTIVIENLNVSGMMLNRRLSRAIGDIGLFEFRRQLVYKAAMSGSSVLVADRWFSSSKICSTCGIKNEDLKLAERTWVCSSCGTLHDRDCNAARNLARYAESSPASACGAEGAGGEVLLAAKPAATKQEEMPGRGRPCGSERVM